MTSTRIVQGGTDTNHLAVRTKAATVMPKQHYEVHEGESFSVSHSFGSVGNGNTVLFRLTTGTKYANLTWSIDAGGLSLITLQEGTTFSVAGTTVMIFNRNRNVSTTTTAVAKHTPTVDDAGTVIRSEQIPGGSNPSRGGGGSSREDLEWIMIPSTDYLWSITNQSGSAQYITIEIDFYNEDTY